MTTTTTSDHPCSAPLRHCSSSTPHQVGICIPLAAVPELLSWSTPQAQTEISILVVLVTLVSAHLGARFIRATWCYEITTPLLIRPPRNTTTPRDNLECNVPRIHKRHVISRPCPCRQRCIVLQGTRILAPRSSHPDRLAPRPDDQRVIAIMKSLSALAGLMGLAAAQSWPNTPFTASGRDILDASGNVVTFAGANWPGAADVMIPEGLQYQSVAYIVSKLKEIGMNAVRLTYAIEMIDQIYENGGEDIPLSQAFISALGEANGTTVFNQVLAANPDFSTNITRLGVSERTPSERARRAHWNFMTDLAVICPGLRCSSCRACRQRGLHRPGQPHVTGRLVLQHRGRQLMVGRHVLLRSQLDQRIGVHGRPCKSRLVELPLACHP